MKTAKKYEHRPKEEARISTTIYQSMTAYYIVRGFAGLFFMMSFGLGFLAGAQFGKSIGWLTFVMLAVVGIALHRIADKTKKHDELHRAHAKEK